MVSSGLLSQQFPALPCRYQNTHRITSRNASHHVIHHITSSITSRNPSQEGHMSHDDKFGEAIPDEERDWLANQVYDAIMMQVGDL